jgi:hypothetical protein
LRWSSRQGVAVVATVMLSLGVLVIAGRTLAPPAMPPGEPAPPPATGSIRYVPPPPGTTPEPTTAWSIVPSGPSGRSRQLEAGDVRLTLPPGWHGRSSTEGHVLILQGANFSLAPRGNGQEPVNAMTREHVVVTVSDAVDLTTAISAFPTIGESDFLHDGRVPAGRAFARKRVQKDGRILSVEVLFGIGPPVPSLLRQTNLLLTSLTVID